VSAPDRLAEQMKVFREDPHTGVVGSLSEMIDASGKLLRPPEAWRISRQSPFVPFAHGAMMYRRSLYERVGGYREECAYWEDQDLVVRMAAFAKVRVVLRPLYQIRAWTRSTRVGSDPDLIEQSLDRMYAVTDRLRQTGDYDLLHAGRDRTKIDPRVFMATGSVRLWAGQKPRLLSRLLARGDLSLDATSLSALVWAAWASVSPGSLRGFLKVLLDIRNRISSGMQASGAAVSWQPSSGDNRLGANSSVSAIGCLTATSRQKQQ
jgi:hypothetical protein